MGRSNFSEAHGVQSKLARCAVICVASLSITLFSASAYSLSLDSRQDNSGLPGGLSKQAMLAAYQSKFRPATKDGQPVEMWIPMAIEFDLR